MNLRQEILKEHTRQHALRIAAYACSSKKNLKELIQCFLDGEYRLAQRAAWSVSWAARSKPEMIRPYIKEVVAALHRKPVHDAVVRNSLRVLQELEIPFKYHGEVMDTCFRFIQEPTTPAAIKAFSLTILFHLSKTYPEIRPELKLLIEENRDHATAAFKARAGKILSKL